MIPSKGTHANTNTTFLVVQPKQSYLLYNNDGILMLSNGMKYEKISAYLLKGSCSNQIIGKHVCVVLPLYTE